MSERRLQGGVLQALRWAMQEVDGAMLDRQTRQLWLH